MVIIKYNFQFLLTSRRTMEMYSALVLFIIIIIAVIVSIIVIHKHWHRAQAHHIQALTSRGECLSDFYLHNIV